MTRTTSVRALLAVGLLSMLAACSNPFGSGDGTRIRLRNSSSFELTDVTFAPGTPRFEFDRIGPGEVTDYRSANGAYSYGYLDVLVGGERRTLQPIDYVGEEPLDDGEYTFVITIEPTTRNPMVELRAD